MFLRRRAAICVLPLMFWNSPALAEVDLAAADSCILDRIDSGKPVAECIEAAQADCAAQVADASAVAAVCFREVRDGWNAGIKAVLDKVQATASEEIGAIAAIEVKYDLLAGLVQCDRMEELARAVSEQSAEVILRQRSQCEASASGRRVSACSASL